MREAGGRFGSKLHSRKNLRRTRASVSYRSFHAAVPLPESVRAPCPALARRFRTVNIRLPCLAPASSPLPCAVLPCLCPCRSRDTTNPQVAIFLPPPVPYPAPNPEPSERSILQELLAGFVQTLHASSPAILLPRAPLPARAAAPCRVPCLQCSCRVPPSPALAGTFFPRRKP